MLLLRQLLYPEIVARLLLRFSLLSLFRGAVPHPNFLPHAFRLTNYEGYRSSPPLWEAALAKPPTGDRQAMNLSLSRLDKPEIPNPSPWGDGEETGPLS